jgi:AcrR family transcriptional regulator
MSVDDRRAMILDAVIPLLIEQGGSVTTRQIADAADIAEGTIFRVFPDKDALFVAALEKFLDPTATSRTLRAIDPALPLEAKVNDILHQLRTRMTGIFGIMNAVGMAGRPPRRPHAESFEDVISDVLRSDLEQLRVPVDRASSFVRLVAFASSMPHFNQGHDMAAADIARFITYGIAGHPAEGECDHAS